VRATELIDYAAIINHPRRNFDRKNTSLSKQHPVQELAILSGSIKGDEDCTEPGRYCRNSQHVRK
jgi:hypothetical protein